MAHREVGGFTNRRINSIQDCNSLQEATERNVMMGVKVRKSADWALTNPALAGRSSVQRVAKR